MAARLEHQGFIDLMKAAGMLFIIFGHIIGDPAHIYNQITQPIFTKQIGVAFFVFITGWGLANNTTPAMQAVFKRVFPFYFYGVIFAVFLSILYYFVKDDTNPSNYLPFFLGINVFFNNFPANPTTWYIGTYIHMLLFWYFFMRSREVGLKHVAIALVVETLVRVFVMGLHKDFVAYMILPNWLTIFMLGMYYRNKKQLPSSPISLILILIWIAFFLVWAKLTNPIGFDGFFPFRHMPSDSIFRLPLESLLISVIYVVHTLFFFEVARRLPSNRIVSFFARATLITVIIHMPIIYATAGDFYNAFGSDTAARISLILCIYVVTAIISEIIHRLINLKSITNKSWGIAQKFLPEN
jgi:hypothetical protein